MKALYVENKNNCSSNGTRGKSKEELGLDFDSLES